MVDVSCAAHEGVRVQEKMGSWDAGTARIAWYCVTLLLALAAIATVAPFTLSPRGAEGIYWFVMGLIERVPSDVAIMNVGQVLIAGEGLWAAPVLLWTFIILYIAVDAALVFSAWLGADMGQLGKKLVFVRPALRWAAAVAMMILLVAGISEHLLREGYVQRPDLWAQKDGSAFPGLMLLFAGALLTPITIFVTVRVKRFVSAAVAYFGRKNAIVRKIACCLCVAGNGVVSWIVLTAALMAGLFAYPALLLFAFCVFIFMAGLWITIKMLPFILGAVFLHLLCDRDI